MKSISFFFDLCLCLDSGFPEPVPVIFFVSYMLVASLVLINIIIAVLLDEFLTTMAKRYSAVLSPCDLVLCSSC